MSDLKRTHDELMELVERVRALTYNIFQYNPNFTDTEKKSLVRLGVESRSIGNSFEIIGVNLINIHKEKRDDSS